MWTPAVAALSASWIVRRKIEGFGFRLGKPRFYFFSYLIPILFCVPVYVLTWALGLGKFDALITVASRFHLPPGVTGFLALLALGLIVAPLAMLDTLGEEIGWSGLLTPRLAEITTFTRASLIRGGVWSLWHYPLVVTLLPKYRRDLPIWYALMCMTVAIVAVSFVYTWLRLRSGSLWPCALLHAVSSNCQDIFESATRNTGPTHYITYEYGAGFAIVLSIMAFFVWRKAA
ncbi:MAG: CPBP family intramembrane metalloprotease [Acidobacteriota bacterium]|nr:CPBP family intramembrane metalloprotease [Acidobacteriota bacterium]